jgi:hypothetical protein
MVDGALMNEVLAGEFAPAEKPGLKDYRIRIQETVFYEVVEQATSEEAARQEIQRQLDEDEFTRDFSEVDSTALSLEEPAPAWVPENHWDEHDHLHVEEWMYDVACRNTRLSYVEWVNSQLESADERA